MLQKFIKNVDTYCSHIKATIDTIGLSVLVIETIYQGLTCIINQINQYAKFQPDEQTDLALEKLYNLQTILSIKLDESE